MVVCPGSSPHDYQKLYDVHYDSEGNYRQCDSIGTAAPQATPAVPVDVPVAGFVSLYKSLIGLALLLLTLAFLHRYKSRP